MKDDTKGAIELSLQILKKTLIEEGVSMAVDKNSGEIFFFDTDTYLATKKFDGFKVDIQNLVK